MAGYKVWGSTDLLASSDVDTFLMQQAIPQFSTVAVRDAMIPAPTAGQMCTTSDFSELYLYNGTTWVGAVPRTKIKLDNTNPPITNDTSFHNDAELFFSLEASSRYTMSYDLQYLGGTTEDIKFTWTYSGTMTDSKWGMHYIPANATTPDNSVKSLDSFSTPLGSAIAVGAGSGNTLGCFGYGYWNTTTGGTLRLQMGQNTSGATNTLISLGSYVSLLKVA